MSGAAIGATAGVADAEVSNATVYRLLAEIRQEMRAMQRPAPVEALTVADCAKALKVGENTVRAMIARGELEAVTLSLGRKGREVYRVAPVALARLFDRAGKPQAG